MRSGAEYCVFYRCVIIGCTLFGPNVTHAHICFLGFYSLMLVLCARWRVVTMKRLSLLVPSSPAKVSKKTSSIVGHMWRYFISRYDSGEITNGFTGESIRSPNFHSDLSAEV